MSNQTIRYSVAGWAFPPSEDGPEAHYTALKAAGYDGVEMIPEAHWPIAREAGLRLLSLVGPGMTKGLNRQANHAELIAGIRERLQVAANNGVEAVIVFSGNREGQDDNDGIANVCQALKQVLPDAEKAGVTLLFEMLNSRNHPDYQADSSAYGFKVARELNHPCLKLIYDLYHMHVMGEDLLADIRDNLDVIGHLHLAEAPDRSTPLATGEIVHAELVPAIKELGYDGFWGMEFIRGETPSLKALTEARATIESCL